MTASAEADLSRHETSAARSIQKTLDIKLKDANDALKAAEMREIDHINKQRGVLRVDTYVCMIGPLHWPPQETWDKNIKRRSEGLKNNRLQCTQTCKV